jgi:hypothetical protein
MRRIFCQRLSNEVAQKHARETKRFRDAVQRIAYALGGRPGERLGQCLGLPIHKDTLLERVKQLAQSGSQAGRILAIGVDEWAWRKGCGSYGTILVDLERRVVADLLPNRSASIKRRAVIFFAPLGRAGVPLAGRRQSLRPAPPLL